MKWDPRWSLYGAILLSGLYLGNSDLTHAFNGYDLDSEAKITVVSHSIIIMYIWLGILFYNKEDIITHLLIMSFIIIMWIFNSNCILSTFLINKANYTEEDYKRIFIENPKRIRVIFRYLLGALAIDCLKLCL